MEGGHLYVGQYRDESTWGKWMCSCGARGRGVGASNQSFAAARWGWFKHYFRATGITEPRRWSVSMAERVRLAKGERAARLYRAAFDLSLRSHIEDAVPTAGVYPWGRVEPQ